MEIAPNVHSIPGVIGNVYLIVAPDGLTLIDTGLGGSDRKILRYIAGIGRAPGDVQRILVTHSDGDHVGALAAVKTATGARIFASAIEARAIQAGKVSRPLKGWGRLIGLLAAPFFRAHPVQVDEYLDDGQSVGGLLVISTPGHTPGHLSFFAPSEKILFCGDSMVEEKGRLRASRGMNTWDQERADASVRRQAALGARIVCSGHGAVVMGAPVPSP